MSGERRAPGRPRSAEADAAIHRAALDLLVERGIEGTSIEQIARRAGVTRATVYRRFPDKVQLLISAIHSTHAVAPTELPEPRDIEEMLAWWARGIADAGVRRLLRRLMGSLHDYPELEEAFTRASIEPRNRWVRGVLERARDRGEFPADADLDVVRQILMAAITTHLTTQPDDASARDIEAFLLAVLHETRYRGGS